MLWHMQAIVACVRGETWQKERIQPYFSVRIVGLNLPNGWDNVPDVKSGIPLLRKSCKRLP